MTTPDIDTEDRPFEVGPALREFVDLAKGQSTPPVRVEFADIAHEVTTQNRRVWWGAAAVMVAAAVAVVAWPRGGPRSDTETRAAPAKVVQQDSPTATAPDPTGVSQPETPTELVEPGVLALAEGIRVVPIDGEAADLSIESAWRVALSGRGSFEVETPLGDKQLEVVVGQRVLEVAGDSLLRVDLEQSSFTVTRGRADWADDGASQSAATEPETVELTPARTESAASLARRAESEMATGRRADAIETLETLVRRHPRAAAARVGLVDLARLYKAAGKTARARCAYQLHLGRFPKSALRADVERALEKLGVGASCRGLRPR